MIDARRSEFERELLPEGRFQLDEVLAIATASVRLERCVVEEQTWRQQRAERAELFWHADRQADTMKLVKRLPKDADQTVAKLLQSLRGCMWMLDEWRDLARHVRETPAAAASRPLDSVGRRRALDLLGLSAERRLGSTPLDLPGGAGSEAELAAHQADLIAAQIVALEALVSEERIANDEATRVATMHGTLHTIDDRTRLIRRYESEARRVKERAREELKRLQETAAKLKKEAAEREYDEWETHCMSELVPQDEIDEATAQEASIPQPHSQAEPHPEAPVVPVEATPTTDPAGRSEAITVLERTLPLTAAPAAPAVLPVTASRPLTRRARKILAARAAHRSMR